MHAIPGIDVHGHIGRYVQSDTPPFKSQWMSGGAAPWRPEPSP